MNCGNASRRQRRATAAKRRTNAGGQNVFCPASFLVASVVVHSRWSGPASMAAQPTERREPAPTRAKSRWINWKRRVLSGIKKRLLDPELLTEFVHEFHSELRAAPGSINRSKLAHRKEARSTQAKDRTHRRCDCRRDRHACPPAGSASLSKARRLSLRKPSLCHRRPILIERATPNLS